MRPIDDDDDWPALMQKPEPAALVPPKAPANLSVLTKILTKLTNQGYTFFAAAGAGNEELLTGLGERLGKKYIHKPEMLIGRKDGPDRYWGNILSEGKTINIVGTREQQGRGIEKDLQIIDYRIVLPPAIMPGWSPAVEMVYRNEFTASLTPREFDFVFQSGGDRFTPAGFETAWEEALRQPANTTHSRQLRKHARLGFHLRKAQLALGDA